MITVQETTSWEGDAQLNHQYIMSDDMRHAYAYIKSGEKYPHIFNQPMLIDRRYRTFKVLIKTKDTDSNRHWEIVGSRGDKYKVTKADGYFTCSCPSAIFRGGECKHIKQIKETT